MAKGQVYFHKAQQINEQLYLPHLSFRVKKRLYEEYLFNIRKAAYLGNTDAAYEYALTFQDINYWGTNPNPNPAKCFKWLTKAAAANHADACNNVAVQLEYGSGCRKNVNLAIKYYRIAIDLGNTSAKSNLRKTLKSQSAGK